MKGWQKLQEIATTTVYVSHPFTYIQQPGRQIYIQSMIITDILKQSGRLA